MARMIFFFPVLAILAACSAQGAAAPSASSVPTLAANYTAFTDPFAYCAAVGTLDKPDASYIGVPKPDSIISGFKRAAGLQSSTEPIEMLRKSTIWRCMDGKVYACNFGANLPCDSKANTDRTPTAAMSDFCAANLNADSIPMAVTGHDTIYGWHCVQGKPEAIQQTAQVDAAGYWAQIWYAIQPVQ